MPHIHTVMKVLTGNIADEMEIETGDKILEINGTEMEDVLAISF